MKLHLNLINININIQICQITGSTLIQVMAGCLFGTKPLPESMLTACKLVLLNKLKRNFHHYNNLFFHENAFEMLSATCPSLCSGLAVLMTPLLALTAAANLLAFWSVSTICQTINLISYDVTILLIINTLAPADVIDFLHHQFSQMAWFLMPTLQLLIFL